MPISRSFCRIRQAFRTCVTNCRRSVSSPIAEPPPVGGQTGATSEPTTSCRTRIRSGQSIDLVVGRVDADVGVEQKQIDAVEPDAVPPTRSR
jgi:hypothetical protein